MAEENSIMTPQQMLAEVNTAITKVLVGGQSYTIGSRSLSRADIGQLRQLKAELEAQISAGGTGLLDNAYIAAFIGR